MRFIKEHKIKILLWFFIGAYILYFSYFSILRYRTLYASYYDLGIMNQTVYNTYRSIVEKKPSKFLELTDPASGTQIKRMAIHNDLLLATIALLYFIYAGPETLLVLQAVVLGLGALAVFKIASYVFEKQRNKAILALIFSVSYLLYPPLERANIFDFHAVTLATTFLLWMVYLWMRKSYVWSFIFFLLSLLSKEQVGLTTALFGVYALIHLKSQISKNKRNIFFSTLVIVVSVLWVVLSFLVIIPYFRGGNHFAVSRYGDFGDSPIRILIGILSNPYSIFRYILNYNTFNYLVLLLGPLGFVSLLSPIQLAISIPEYAVNLFSNTWGMRSIIYHYTAVITPFVFLSAIYGVNKILNYKLNFSKYVSLLVVFFTLFYTYFNGPLPYMKGQEVHPYKYPQPSMKEITIWAKTLRDPTLKIAVTGHAAPLFSSRQYLYHFSDRYVEADYVVLTLEEIYNYPEKDMFIPLYDKLKEDPQFKLIYQSKIIEVYKKI